LVIFLLIRTAVHISYTDSGNRYLLKAWTR